jgi:hypothetical protein
MSSRFKYSQYFKVRRHGSVFMAPEGEWQAAKGMSLGRDRGFHYRRKYGERTDYREWIRRSSGFGFIPRHPFIENGYP